MYNQYLCPYYTNTPVCKSSNTKHMQKMCPYTYFPKTPTYNPYLNKNGSIRNFISTLEERGFIVQEGKLKYLDLLKLASEGKTESAFANNAGAPYATYFLPPAPNQDPSPGQKPPKGYNPDNPNNYPANMEYMVPGLFYKLRPDEAIVLIGVTPPEAQSFSYRSYLQFVENKLQKDYSDFITAGNENTGFYHFISSSMGDQIDSHRIWTDNTPYGSPGNSFNSSTIIITTADMGINKLMRDALIESGFSSGIMNDDNIPRGLVNMGLERGKDTFSLIFRAAIWEDSDIGWDYINNLENYVKVFRITPKASYPALNPWPIPSLIVKETGINEFQILPYARNELDYLRNEILKKYGNEEYDHVDLDLDLWIFDGYEGILQDVSVFADDRDAIYLKTNDFQLATDDDFVIIYGVDHTETGMATFTNASFYGAELWNGVVPANTTDELKHPADEYFPKGYQNAGCYYVIKMARKTEEGNEVIIPYSTGNPSGSAYGVDNNQYAYIGFRIYQNKQTKVAPAHFDVIWDHAILFTKRKNR